MMNKIEIEIETLTGQNIPIIAYPDDTVLGLKTKILLKQNVPVSHQHLIWNSCALEDSKTLKEIGIHDGSKVTLVLHLKGGPMYTRKLTFYKEAANFLKKSSNLETLLNDSYFDHYYNGKSYEHFNKGDFDPNTKGNLGNNVEQKGESKDINSKAIAKKYSLPSNKIAIHKSNTLIGSLKYYNFSLNESFIKTYGNPPPFLQTVHTQPFLKIKENYTTPSPISGKNFMPESKSCKVFIPVTGITPKWSMKLLCPYSEEENLEDEDGDSGSSDENGPKSRDVGLGKKSLRDNVVTMNKMKALRLQMETLKQSRKPKRKHPSSSHLWVKPNASCVNAPIGFTNAPTTTQHSSYHPSYTATMIPFKKSGPLYSFTLEGAPLYNTRSGGPVMPQTYFYPKYGRNQASLNSRVWEQTNRGSAVRAPAGTPSVETCVNNGRIRIKTTGQLLRCDSTTDGEEFEYTSSCKEEEDGNSSGGNYFGHHREVGLLYHRESFGHNGVVMAPKISDIKEYASAVIENVCADIKGNLKTGNSSAPLPKSPSPTSFSKAAYSNSKQQQLFGSKQGYCTFRSEDGSLYSNYKTTVGGLKYCKNTINACGSSSSASINGSISCNSNGKLQGGLVSRKCSSNGATTTANSCCSSSAASNDSGSASSTLSSTSEDESNLITEKVMTIKNKNSSGKQYAVELDVKTLKNELSPWMARKSQFYSAGPVASVPFLLKPARTFAKANTYTSDADSEATTHHLEEDARGGAGEEGGDGGSCSQTPRFKKKSLVNRCFACGKKIGIASSFICRCNKGFCPGHRYPETHGCTIDYKTEGRKLMELAALEAATPVQKLHNL